MLTAKNIPPGKDSLVDSKTPPEWWKRIADASPGRIHISKLNPASTPGFVSPLEDIARRIGNPNAILASLLVTELLPRPQISRIIL
jgi:hypothetical protein